MGTVRVYGGKASAAPGAHSPLLSGLLTGIVLALVWILLVWFFHNRLSVAAWGVGALLGVVIATVARPPGKSTGTLAALLTVGTVFLAKAGVVVIALQPMLRDELIRNEDAITALYMVDMLQQREFSPQVQATLDADSPASPADEEFSFQVIAEAEARANGASRAERERLVARHADQFVSTLGFWVLFGGMFGLLDLLWLGLGVSTAWKLGQGIG